jgi:MarR family transcriptional regulator, 2-MHQ and catechol-resistance regulon repressor
MTTTFDPVDLRRESDPELLEDGRTFARALSELIRIVQFRDRDRACCYDVSVSQCYALEGVVEAGALTINDLAGHLYLDKSTASRIANGLVERGLLERERSAEDGRVVRLVPTGEGRALCGRIHADLANEYSELLRDYDEPVREAAIEVVRRLARSFSARVDTTGGSCCVVR